MKGHIMFLIKLNYLKPIEIVDQYLAEHRAYLEEGYQNNFFIVSGPQNPRTGGIILSQLKDKAQLQDIIQKDPFYIHQVANFEIIEFAPVKYHTHFAKFVE
jgi:uncharacterized protein YciI